MNLATYVCSGACMWEGVMVFLHNGWWLGMRERVHRRVRACVCVCVCVGMGVFACDQEKT